MMHKACVHECLPDKFIHCSISLATASEEQKPTNVSIMTQGAILGTTIGGMVKDNSSSIAG